MATSNVLSKRGFDPPAEPFNRLMNASPPLIEAVGLSKTFTDFWGRPATEAVKDLSLTVTAGQTIGLLGPNGAGKSTFLKMLLGHLNPTAGRLRIMGTTPNDTAIKSRIGYLPENPAFWNTLTGYETLFFFGRLYGLSRTEVKQRSEQLFEMTGLAHAADRKTGAYSHGMRKRLGLAQSLLNDPDLLILDEPTAGMDPLGCREVKNLIQTLAKRGKTILMTSHLLADVQDVCSEAVILYGGAVCARGPIRTLLEKPNETLIRTTTLTPHEESQLRHLLHGKEIEITHPEQSLESFFIQTVENAKMVGETSGARSGNGVAEYLSQPSVQQILESLEKKNNVTDTKIAQEPDHALLDALSHPAEPPKAQTPVDREKLDALTK